MLGRLTARPAAARAAGRGELLERFGLDAAGRPVRSYSGGMRRGSTWPPPVMATAASCSWTSPPPASTRGADELWAAIRDRSQAARRVLLTTQYLEEADQLADRIASSTEAA